MSMNSDGTPIDIKPRSRDVTDGIQKAAARAMLRAVGLGDDDWVKPQIGIASAWNEITPCNMSLRRSLQASVRVLALAGVGGLLLRVAPAATILRARACAASM